MPSCSEPPPHAVLRAMRIEAEAAAGPDGHPARSQVRALVERQLGGGGLRFDGDVDLVAQLLVWDPAARPSAAGALAHRMFLDASRGD